MRQFGSMVVLALCWSLAQAPICWGQVTRRGSTSSGLFGNRSIGSPFTQATPPTLFGRGGSRGTGLAGQGGETFQSKRLPAGSTQRGFVGGDAATMRNALRRLTGASNSALQRGGNRPFSAQSQRVPDGGRRRQFRSRPTTGRGDSNPPIAIQRRSWAAFDTPGPDPSAVSATVSAAVADRLARYQNASGWGAANVLNVTIEKRTATLRGTVPNVYQRHLVEALVSLEPGVDRIRNELVVATAPSASSEPGSVP